MKQLFPYLCANESPDENTLFTRDLLSSRHRQKALLCFATQNDDGTLDYLSSIDALQLGHSFSTFEAAAMKSFAESEGANIIELQVSEVIIDGEQVRFLVKVRWRIDCEQYFAFAVVD